MNENCLLYNPEAEINAISSAVICFRGECLVCVWDKENAEYRKKDLREKGLSEATPAEVKQYLRKHRGMLSQQAIEYIRENGLRFYRVRRELRR